MLDFSQTTILLSAAFAVFLIWVAFGFHSVNQWERQPVMFFGNYAWTAGPGIIWVPPIIFQMIALVPVQDEVFTITVIARTKDNIPLEFKVTFASRVLPDRVRDVVIKVKNGIGAVLALADTAAVEIVGNTDYEHVQGHVEGEEKKFAADVLKVLQERVADRGIQISKLGLSNITITDSTIAESVSRVARANTDAKAEEILSSNLAKAAGTYGCRSNRIALATASRGKTFTMIFTGRWQTCPGISPAPC
jgi:regulator of protease activity HflC (stomatin/prohibitin superfamily)